jgi:hypothetical protein
MIKSKDRGVGEASQLWPKTPVPSELERLIIINLYVQIKIKENKSA